MMKIIFCRFDDWYLYFCDGVMLEGIFLEMMWYFVCVIIMLNFVLLVVMVVDVCFYCDWIVVVILKGDIFELLMMFYLIEVM